MRNFSKNINFCHKTSLNSERLFKKAADILVSEGYKDAGYEYVIIDDCWMEWERDPVTKRLVADRKRFPSGIKALAEYVSTAGMAPTTNFTHTIGAYFLLK